MPSLNRRAGGWIAVLGLLVALPPLSTARAAADTRESWDAIYIGNNKVGHTHIKVAPVKDRNGRELFRVQVNTVLSFKRADDRINMEIRYGTIETHEGAVLRLDTRTRAGEEEMRTYGDVVDGKMNLTLDAGGKEQQVEVPWGPEIRGPYAAELSLTRQPIKPGETRDVKTFIPELNRVCTSRLAAKDAEDVVLGRGARQNLLRVELSVLDASGKNMPELESTCWVDSGGQILKTHTALLGGMDSYRTTREGALAANGNFDLLAATMLKVARKIPNSERTRDVVYRMTLDGDDLKAVFPADGRQTLKPGPGPGQGILEVKTEPQPAPGSAAEASPGEEFTRANPLINSDDPLVIDHMRQAVGNRTDAWAKAVAIEDWVFTNMKRKNFSTAFASAREVARNLEGDCSEHGVLTAAMCRAAGIPARVAVGLIYVDASGAFGPHLWNEVFVGGRWVAIDAAWRQSAVDATHIKISESSLDGVAPFEAFQPVLRVVNKLKIEPLEVR